MGPCLSTEEPGQNVEKINNTGNEDGVIPEERNIGEGEKTIKEAEKVIKEEEKAVEEPKNIATVKVVSCRGLRNADWVEQLEGVSDAYVVAKVGDKEILRTNTIPNALEPYFNQEFELPLLDISADITFEVFDKDNKLIDDKLGHATLKTENFMDKGFNGEIELADAHADKCNKAYIKVMVKLPGIDYPAGPMAEFDITLKKKANSEIGFAVDIVDKSCLFIVSESFKTPAKEHNESKEWDQQLKKMQFIFAVNGISGDAEKMKKELKAAAEVTLTIRRPHVFTITLEKKKGPLGVDLVDAPTSSFVREIPEAPKEGCIQAWNAGHQGKEVQKGDRIIQVSGQMGQGKKLTGMLKKDGKKQIVVCRPATPGLLDFFWSMF